MKELECKQPGYVFSFRTVRRKLIFGTGSIDQIGVEAKQLGGKNVFLVTDNVIDSIGLAGKVRNLLEEGGFEVVVFNEVRTEPTLESVELAINAIRNGKYDIVTGVGGGSSLDTAKVASIMATNPGDFRWPKVGIERDGLPMILIPTTAGTGSEVTEDAVFFVGKEKRWLSDPRLLPDIAIVDPLMTVSMPPKTTASSGLDALCHAIESLMTMKANPLTDALALEAVRLIANNLRKAYFQGEDLKARSEMALAATLGGMSSENAGCTLPHSAGYTYAAEHDLPHGVSCAIALPSVMEFNLHLCLDKFTSVASSMGEVIDGLSPYAAAIKAIKAVKKLIEDVEVPTSLRDVGVPKEDLSKLVNDFVVKYPRPHNTRRVTKDNAMKLYEKMWEGKITE